MEYKSNKPEARLAFRLLWVLFIVLVIVLTIALSLDLPLLDFMKQLLPSIVWNFELVKSLPDNCFPSSPPSNANFIEVESCSAIIRNFGLMIGIGLSFIIAVFGSFLALWGRHIQNKQWNTQHESYLLKQRENLEERYEKAANMLSSELEATRVAGCLSLADLGKADESMKSRCEQLLFAFIKKPYLEDDEKGKSLDERFPVNDILRPDIQEAATSFSDIYECYSETDIDNKQIKLPSYFWKNQMKGGVFLAKASLQEADLQGAKLKEVNLQGAGLEGADLQEADLQGANLRGAELQEADLQGVNLQEADLRGAKLQEANLQEANVQGADLENADISLVDMREIYNLTKEHVLSAKWGYDANRYGGPPQLPANLVQDNDIEEWLKNAFYGEKKKYKISQLYHSGKKSLSLMLPPFNRILDKLLTLLVSSKFRLQGQEMLKNRYTINNADSINMQYMIYDSHDENLQKQFEKAIDMLNSDDELERIRACSSLMDLGKSDESMKSQCVRLLFSFISKPYLEATDKGKSLDELFPADKPLRADISEAISSFSVIYRHYFMDGVDDGRIVLPNYFWANELKGNLYLLKANLGKANLQGANLQGANLRATNFQEADLQYINLQRANLLVANLRGANLWRADLQDANLSMASLLETELQNAILQNANLRKARLKGANLGGADLQGADISNAKMQEAKNLTKEQILSARWGYAKYGSRHQPRLPEALKQDEDIKRWLETPAYDRREPKDSQ